MKSTGIVKKVDEFGRVVIPIELRRELGIDIKGAIEFSVDGQQVVLRSYAVGCSFCGCSGTVFELGNIMLCGACRDFCTGFGVGSFMKEGKDARSLSFPNMQGREQCHGNTKLVSSDVEK